MKLSTAGRVALIREWQQDIADVVEDKLLPEPQYPLDAAYIWKHNDAVFALTLVYGKVTTHRRGVVWAHINLDGSNSIIPCTQHQTVFAQLAHKEGQVETHWFMSGINNAWTLITDSKYNL